MGEHLKTALKNGKLEVLDSSTPEEIRRAIGEDGFTPLHWACHYGQAKILHKLLQLGADGSARTKLGWTGMHICAIRGQMACAQVLLSAGEDSTQMDAKGYTPLHLSAAHGTCTILQCLLKTGKMNVDVLDHRGWMPLHHAAFHGRLGAMQILIQAGAILTGVNQEGRTPAHLAAAEGHVDCLRLLLQTHRGRGTQLLEVLHMKDKNGLTPKDLATHYQKGDCKELLVEAEFRAVERAKYEDEYPAHAACHHGNVESLRQLVEDGLSFVDDRDCSGDTLAHVAVSSNQVNCLEWLVANNADIELVNRNGETPEDLAKRLRHLDCISVLNADGALQYERQTPQERLAEAECEVMELQRKLEEAKARFHRLGGVLSQEVEERQREEARKRELVGLKVELQCERERREALEWEMDSQRRQLHLTALKLLRMRCEGLHVHGAELRK